jgi:cardiolipin synthase A/B
MRELDGGRGGELRVRAGEPPEQVPARPPANALRWNAQVSTALLARYYLPAAHAPLAGNACELLRDGTEVYPAMLHAIRCARRYVHLETYMFLSDAVGELFGEALAEAAGRGVHVKVLYDAVGSWSSRGDFFESLRARGVDIRPFKPINSLARGVRHLFRRDHRKILSVDGEVAFIGGVNIAVHWAPRGHGGECWRDDVLRVEGPAVHELERRFVATWRMAFQDKFRSWREGRRLRKQLRRQPVKGIQGGVGLAVLSNRRSIHRAYLHAISRARKSVLVAAAYFVPDRRLLGALRDAALRGVEVRLLLNARGDHPWIMTATRSFYEKLLTAGVRIFEWEQCVLHSKTAVVDGAWGTIGSFNLERMSFRFNHEVNAVFTDPRLGRQMDAAIRGDCAQGREVHLAEFRRRPLWHKLLERVLYAFRRFI